MKYHVITYGCQMNKADSEKISGELESLGYKKSLKKEADLIVVNMCSVRQSAVDRVYGKVQNFKILKKKNPKLKTVLTGCVLKSDKEKFEKKFDFILGIKDLADLQKILKPEKKKSSENPLPENNRYFFIPISRGCNNACSYCVVPFTRGALACRDPKEILNELKEAVSKGIKEIWFLGQNVNDYQSKGINFSRLLKMANEAPGDFWIRFTSPHPQNFSDELIKTMAECLKITPYLNLPVQSGDDEILRRMNRHYTAKDYKKLIKKIRDAFKKYRKELEREISISTDIILGFPGETKKQFENTVKLLKEVEFDMAYIAKYSPRPGTVSSKIKDSVAKKEKEKRWNIFNEALKKIVFKNNKKYVGKEVRVLVEEKNGGFLSGKTRTYKTVRFASSKNLTGKIVNVKIFKALPWGLEGKII